MPTNKHELGGFELRERSIMELLNGPETWVLHFLPATICPCRGRSDASPSPNCTNCSGYGYTWSTPTTEQAAETFYMGSTKKPPTLTYSSATTADLISVIDEDNTTYADATLNNATLVWGATQPASGKRFTITYTRPKTYRGHINNLMTHREWRELGEITHSDLHLTVDAQNKLPDGTLEPNPAWFLSEHDRVILPDVIRRIHEVLFRGDPRERLTYTWVRSIERIYSVDRTTYATTDYVETTDYTLVPGGINWVAGQGPALDTPYAVTYRAAPEYFVMAELPQVRHQGGKNLPRRVALRLFEKFPRAVTLKR